MADLSPYPGMPRWVKISGIFAAVLMLAAVIAIFASGGGHGPGRHLSSSSITEPGVQR